MIPWFATPFLTCLILIFHLSAFAGGSRVGNGSNTALISQDGTYSIKVPSDFQAQKMLGGGFRLSGPSLNKLGMGNPNFLPRISNATVDILKLGDQVPELKQLDKNALSKWFAENHYEKVHDRENGCVIARSRDEDGISTTLVVWAKGTGLAISADKTKNSQKTLDEILNSLQINKGECEWSR